jgi:hypothetical protein
MSPNILDVTSLGCGECKPCSEALHLPYSSEQLALHSLTEETT